MADIYTDPQTITKVQAGGIGTTLLRNPQQTIQFNVPILENIKTVTSNYTITTGSGGWSVGPININAVVRIPDGSSWTII